MNVKINAQQWGAFINEVQAQTGKKIDAQCANDLIQIATYLLNNPTSTLLNSQVKTMNILLDLTLRLVQECSNPNF
jgi:hypothetical protein